MIRVFSLVVLLSLSSLYADIQHDITATSPHETTVELAITLKPHEYIYKDFLHITSDHPDIQISEWHTNKQPRQEYDDAFKDSKLVYHDNLTIQLNATKKSDSPVHDASLHIAYLTNQNKAPQEHLVPISFEEKAPAETLSTEPSEPAPHQEAPSPQPIKSDPTKTTEKKSISWSESIATILKKTDSLSIRLLLVFLLGLLLSLTPCIYPMIPITIGILQAQGRKSFWHNFSVSLMYTFGMATTFALFGLLASCVGPLCGKLLVQPAFILAFVTLLGYFAFSMFGFYDMYTPRFLTQQGNFKGGSFITAFIFGAASGTIASPCVSPGLALVLTVVATLGNSFLGFLLLFAFGVGLSMPLLVVGTFSSSLNMLPSAGMWMIEVKRLFGFMLLGMCFYYLSYIAPFHILMGIAAAIMIIVGIFYINSAQRAFGFWKSFNHLLGIALIAGSVVAGYYGIMAYLLPPGSYCTTEQEQMSYECARELALKENKKIFVDFWATFCPVCLAINKKVLPDETVKKSLENYVVLKVDGTYDSNEPFATLEKKYAIKGFPTFLIVDPKTEEVVERLGAEIYDMKPSELADIFYKFDQPEEAE